MPHTPEPWRQHHKFAVVMSENLQTGIADCRTVDLPHAQHVENARRIVACVNACGSVPTDYLEKLEPGALADLVEGYLAAKGD